MCYYVEELWVIAKGGSMSEINDIKNLWGIHEHIIINMIVLFVILQFNFRFIRFNMLFMRDIMLCYTILYYLTRHTLILDDTCTS
jgi:hypothetical protein